MEDWGAVRDRLERWLTTRTEFIRIEPIAADIRAALMEAERGSVS